MRGSLFLACLVAAAASAAMSGCTDQDGNGPANGADDLTGGDSTSTTYLLFEGTQAWPSAPGMPETTMSFEVPANASKLHVSFTWHGQAPGGYSGSRTATLVGPDGTEQELMTQDLPINPYLCAAPACGPAPRTYDFHSGIVGTWTLRLGGAYTATAVLSATLETAPGT